MFARLSKRPTKELEQSLKDALFSGRIADREVGVLLAILEERNSRESQTSNASAGERRKHVCERSPIKAEATATQEEDK